MVFLLLIWEIVLAQSLFWNVSASGLNNNVIESASESLFVNYYIGLFSKWQKGICAKNSSNRGPFSWFPLCSFSSYCYTGSRFKFSAAILSSIFCSEIFARATSCMVIFLIFSNLLINFHISKLFLIRSYSLGVWHLLTRQSDCFQLIHTN